MIYVRTVTGKPSLENSADMLLCSPSFLRPTLIRGRSLTIVDCHTFYLRKGRRDIQKAIDHYIWFCEFAKANKHDDSLVFIAPDYDWIGPCPSIFDAWPKDAKCLVVPHTPLFTALTNIVGHAWAARMPRTFHPDWIHHLGREFMAVENYTGLQTYDSVSPC